MEAGQENVRQVVERYFELVRALRNGDQEAVPELMALWDQDGVFEFAGAPPVLASFRGASAIHTLYKNRLNSSGMKVRMEPKLPSGELGAIGNELPAGNAGESLRDLTLDVVDTDVTHIRSNGNRAVVGWRTTVGTKEGIGFDVAGSHQFTLEGGKIKSIRINVSPKPDQSRLANLKLEDLDIADVGRLSLAAWAVV